MEKVLQMTDIVKHFKNVEALRGVSLSVNRGETVAIIGPSGSGKSTLLRCINRLEKINSGTIIINDEELCHTDNHGKAVYPSEKIIRKLCSETGMVFQHFNLFPHMTCLKNVSYGPIKVKKVPKEEALEDGLKYLELVGLLDKKDVYPAQLSGGQKQRVAIAGVIAMRTECIVFDEPTAMLDPKGRQEVFRAIKSLNKDFNITVILITHFMDEAVFADRVIVMDDGYVRLDGSPREVFKRVKSLRDMGLDVPKPLQLALLLKKEGIDLGDEILTNEDFIKEFLNYSGRNNVNT